MKSSPNSIANLPETSLENLVANLIQKQTSHAEISPISPKTLAADADEEVKQASAN
jgi:hypothetical protein